MVFIETLLSGWMVRFGSFLSHVVDENTKHELAGAVSETVQATAEATAQSGAPAADDPMALIPQVLMWVVLGVAFYFLVFRQPRKEQKAKNAMRESIRIGDSVLTVAGFYGKVVDIGADVFMIELGNNRGVRVAVKKEAIEGVGEPVLVAPEK